MRLKHRLIIGVVLTLLTIPIIFLTISGIKAKKFYTSTELSIQTNDFDSLLVDDKLSLAYVKADKINFQTQKITGEILEEKSLETNNPVNLQLYFNESVMVIWESGKEIFYSNFNDIVRFGPGERPIVFSNVNEFYVAFIRDNNLLCHKFMMHDSLWVIDYAVTDFTITSTENINYITWTKNGVIHYRICDYRLWSPIETFQTGLNPIIVPAPELEMRYLYYFANDSLQVGYGVDKLTHNKEIMRGTISHISAYPTDPAVIVFVKEGEIFLQELIDKEISDFYLIIEGQEPQLHFYKNLIIIIYRDGLTYYSLIINKDTKLFYDFFNVSIDSLGKVDTQSSGGFEAWVYNYNEYYSLVLSENDWWSGGAGRVWLMENPIWLVIIFWTFIFLAILILFLIGRFAVRQIIRKRSGGVAIP